MIPPVAVLVAGRWVRACRSVAVFYWRMAVWIIGFDIVVRGTPTTDRPALFVSNHTSYLDIVVLGALVPAAFVAKKEVNGWPGVNVLAKLGRTVFVDRRPRQSIVQRDEMVTRLTQDGESLILFPEGTSSDGNRVLPFKSALLSAAQITRDDGRPLTVQPLSVAYTRLDGMPMGRGWRPFFAWYGDMEMASHLWTALGLGRLTVEVDFLPPVSLADFPSRKALADHCQKIIKDALIAANAGLAPAGSPA
jgi:1-acyl-sn-glycerol-3-phosphate acyltransferase